VKGEGRKKGSDKGGIRKIEGYGRPRIWYRTGTRLILYGCLRM